MVVHPLWRPFRASANAERQSGRVAHRQTPPGALEEYRPSWAADYRAVRERIERALPERVIHLQHVGSTAVAGLIAKPVIDVDLTVADPRDEPAYLPALGDAGFRLIFRDAMAGDPHRQLTLAAPNANLHVWGPGAIEPQRHALFAAWLRAHADDRERYAAAKRAARDPSSPLRYNDAKAAVVYDIHERAFLADPRAPHDPQPRDG